MGIPYEFDGKGEISEINAKIYDLKCKMADEFKGEQCDIDDYMLTLLNSCKCC